MNDKLLDGYGLTLFYELTKKKQDEQHSQLLSAVQALADRLNAIEKTSTAKPLLTFIDIELTQDDVDSRLLESEENGSFIDAVNSKLYKYDTDWEEDSLDTIENSILFSRDNSVLAYCSDGTISILSKPSTSTGEAGDNASIDDFNAEFDKDNDGILDS